MSVRHGFSEVPRWRSRGLLGIALTGALLAELFVATGEALAAPATAPTQEEPTGGPEGLEAPDAASAMTIARLQGERVEVVGERTATSSTWALPDGSFSTGLATGPIWVRQGDGDGTSSADWAPVDLTLEVGEDGTVRPKAHPAELVLAGEGTPEDGLLLSMRRAGGESVGLEWDGPLPAPRLEGPRAVYPQVQPGVDLVVEATRTGYEQFFVLTDRPAAGQLPGLALRARATELTASEAADGGVVFTDAAGEVAGTSGTPLVWDAGVDAQRLHPVAEPWTAEGELDTVMAEMPDWSALPGAAEGQTPPTPGSVSVPPPSEAPAEQLAEAGQAGSPEAVEAGASVGLALATAAEVVAPDAVVLSLTPDEGFLRDPDTVFPVVVDPEYSWSGMFDTFVQTGFASDQSGSPELRIGTYDGGTTVARSFLSLNVGGLAGKYIVNAQLSLANSYSATCSPREWQVWNTAPASTATRINSQPPWYDGGPWATSTATVGYSSACPLQDYTDVNVRSLVQYWASAGIGNVGIGLRASQTDSTAWKKFFSAQNGSGIPTLWVQWNTPPGSAIDLSVSSSPAPLAQPAWTSDATPRLSARAQDPDPGARVDMTFVIRDPATGTRLFQKQVLDVVPGQAGYVDVPAGVLQDGGQYNFSVFSHDGMEGNAANSAFYNFVVDTTAPAAPAIASAQYPADGQWRGDIGQPGTFTFTLPAVDASIDGIEWELNKTPVPTRKATVGAGSTTASVEVTPDKPGRQVLQALAVDRAGNRSPVVSYVFYVGRGGLTSPTEGAEVVRRVRLAVEGEPDLTHVKFQWRRGPDSADERPVALPLLTRADGTVLTDEWTAVADLGGYATWDAGLTLGHVPGPVQVRALMATDATGTGLYAGPWVTVTVSPDAQNAATDSVGPGAVNLLTGDYTLSSTDVDEFGLAIGRTASSRNPRAGLELQAELLNASQQVMSSPLTQVYGRAATATVDTTRWHGGNNSLKVVPTGASQDSYAYPGPQNSGDIGMKAGRTYRVSGWIHVPSATGLDATDPRGLRIVGYYTSPTAPSGRAEPRRRRPRPAPGSSCPSTSPCRPVPPTPSSGSTTASPAPTSRCSSMTCRSARCTRRSGRSGRWAPPMRSPAPPTVTSASPIRTWRR